MVGKGLLGSYEISTPTHNRHESIARIRHFYRSTARIPTQGYSAHKPLQMDVRLVNRYRYRVIFKRMGGNAGAVVFDRNFVFRWVWWWGGVGLNAATQYR